jgi:hypothetical protein
MTLRGRFGIIRNQKELTGNVLSDIERVPETSEMIWTLSETFW